MRLTDGDAFFIDAHALHAIEIVEDQALAAAYRDYFADFIRIGPTDVNIADDVVGIAEGDEGNVFARVSQGARADGAGPLRLFVEQIIEDGNIVRGQIPDGIDVRDEWARDSCAWSAGNRRVRNSEDFTNSRSF